MTTDSLSVSALGIARGVVVTVFTHPIDTVRYHLQTSPEKLQCRDVIKTIWQRSSFRGFYGGLTPHLGKTVLKQAWLWPMIAGVPARLEKHGIESPYKEVLTGIAIAFVDAAITTPFEKAKITGAAQGQKISWQSLRKGWTGTTTNFARLSVTMSTFLVTQERLRRHYSQKSHSLAFSELAKIGVITAIVVSIVSAPFDAANTRKQTDTKSIKLFTRPYRGFPCYFTTLVIQNMASAWLIDYLARRKV
ncbi:MAG: hypothetical protein JSR76_05945 [Verrucomicrobia bacterium]|nr:hypothetical protein [Verrucomicrobiota bacterium]